MPIQAGRPIFAATITRLETEVCAECGAERRLLNSIGTNAAYLLCGGGDGSALLSSEAIEGSVQPKYAGVPRYFDRAGKSRGWHS